MSNIWGTVSALRARTGDMGLLWGTDKPDGGLLKQRLEGLCFGSLDQEGISKEGEVNKPYLPPPECFMNAFQCGAGRCWQRACIFESLSPGDIWWNYMSLLFTSQSITVKVKVGITWFTDDVSTCWNLGLGLECINRQRVAGSSTLKELAWMSCMALFNKSLIRFILCYSVMQ